MINIFIKLVLFGILVSADNECLNISPPSDVRIASRDDRIVVQWSSKSECNVRYKVTVQKEGEEDFILKYLTNKTFFTISRKSMSCSKIEVTVKAIGKNSKSDVVTSSYFIKPTQEDIDSALITYDSFDSTTRELKWSMDRNFSLCKTEFQVSINNHEPFKTEEKIYQLPEDKLNSICQNNDVKIKIIVDGISGREQQIEEKIIVYPTVEEVQEAIVIFDDFNPETRILSWNLNRPFTECIVTYDVTVNNLPPTRVYTNNVNLQTVQLNPTCENNLVMVKPEIHYIPGRDQLLDGRIVVYPTVEEVHEATVTFDNFNSETKILSWELNRPFTECIVIYNVAVNNLPPIRVETNNVNLHTVELNPVCENNIVMVKPEIQFIQGSDQQYNGIIAVEPSFIPIVRRSLTEFWEIDRRVRIFWEPPLGLEVCELRYNVLLLGSHGTIILQSGYDLVEREFRYESIPISENCDTIQVSIVATFGNIIGTPFNHVTCITL